jgi:endonuclease/exonuclease/phosphatase (EEP) superfamily protein YafD
MSAKRAGRLLLVPVWSVVLVLVGLVVAHLVAFDRIHILLLVNAFTLWIYLPAYFIVVAALCFRARLLAVVAGLVVVAHVVWVVSPVLRADSASAAASRAPHARIVSANLRFNNEDRALLLAEIEGFRADVIVLEEVTPAWWTAIERSGLRASHPEVAKVIRDNPGGMAILSRHPLTDIEVRYANAWPIITATIAIDGRRVHVAGVHPVAPISSFANNQRAQRVITAIARDLARPRVVVGDFNASPYNRWHRQLLDLGLRDAHEVVGRPFATTWPNGRGLLPPLRLDYVFAERTIVPLDAREGRGQGSDHRPIVVDLALVR